MDPALAQRFVELTGVELPEHLHDQFRFAPPDMDWHDIAFALGDEIADQLRELNEPRATCAHGIPLNAHCPRCAAGRPQS